MSQTSYGTMFGVERVVVPKKLIPYFGYLWILFSIFRAWMSLANKGDQIHPPKIPLDILDDSVRESFPDDLGSVL